MISIDAAKLILKPFLKTPIKSQYLRQIANNCELSYERVHHHLNELEKEKLVSSKAKGTIKEYTINLKHALTPKIFSLLEYEKRKKFFEKNPKLQSWLRLLMEKLETDYDKSKTTIEFILLFGSAARQDAKKTSDIDLLIIVKNKDKNFEKICESIKKQTEALTGKIFSLNIIEITEFRKKWKKEPVYATIWIEYIILKNEENFWNEVLSIGEPI